MEAQEKKAKDILQRELGYYYEGETYEQLKEDGDDGYSHSYLQWTVDEKTCSTSAKLNSLKKLVKIDLDMGTTLPETIYNCCFYAPVIDFVKMILSFGNNQNMDQLVNDVLKYQDDGFNCLLISTNQIIGYKNATGKIPNDTIEIKRQSEELILYLINLEFEHGIDMDKILNATKNSGVTLFHQMTVFSYEKVALLLLDNDVRVNSINQYFQTPSLTVSDKTRKI